MAEPARFDDTFVAGDTYPMTLTLVGNEVSGGSATLHIRRRPEESPIITVIGALSSGGRLVFNIPPEATRRLDSARDGYNKFLYNVQYTDSTGIVQTILLGQFRVLKDLAV